jgi:hypothetical protein
MIIFIRFFTTEALMMAREKGNCYGWKLYAKIQNSRIRCHKRALKSHNHNNDNCLFSSGTSRAWITKWTGLFWETNLKSWIFFSWIWKSFKTEKLWFYFHRFSIWDIFD